MTTIDAASDRHEEMTEALGHIRPGRRSIPLETVLLTLGAVCLPAGLIAILLGWYGVSHTGHAYEQNSYVISGGFFGLALVFIGGFLYFGYWMTRQIHATNAASQQALRAIARVEAQLAGSGAAPSPAHPASSGPAMLVATNRGSLVHRPDCSVVAGKANTRLVPADARGYSPCRICRPLDD